MTWNLRWTLATGCIILLTTSLVFPQQSDPSKPPPDAASQKLAEKQIRDLFKDE